MTPFQTMILSGLISAAALPASAEVPRVVTDLPITASLVQQVMGDLGQPDLLLDKGADPHHFQLRPDQARALSRADLLIWVGPEMTPWLDRGAESLASDTSALLLLAVPQTHRIAFAEAEAEAESGDHHDDHADSHDHAGGHDHGHGHDHDHSGLDPHAWLDPENALTWLDAIAGALAEADPENAETYAANAADAHRQIAALDAELRTELAPYTDQRFVVFHDAYGYFTQHYGLHPAIPVSLGDASAPSAGQLGAIRDRIAAEKAACAFPEANHDSRLLATAIEGSEARLGAPLDPGGSTHEPGPELYAQTLRSIGQALSECLSKG